MRYGAREPKKNMWKRDCHGADPSNSGPQSSMGGRPGEWVLGTLVPAGRKEIALVRIFRPKRSPTNAIRESHVLVCVL